MAGTEDYSFYYSLENSPFWIKKTDSAASAETEGSIQHENKAVTSPKYRYGINNDLFRHILFSIALHNISFLLNLNPDDIIDSSRIQNPSFGIMRLAAENLLCHPFLVLRRQCQVKMLYFNFIDNFLIPLIFRLMCFLENTIHYPSVWFQ